ncbi:MAG: hypothetical protein FVQ84_00475 [Planctomycetes bacterium]|nr:hypothetical protein [Planctomycetota bacterium]
MNAHEINVSVIDPIVPAFEKVKTILFRPFDFGKWFIIGFCAWLAYLGSGGGGGGGGGGGRGGRGPSNIYEGFGQAKEFVLANLHWIIPVTVVVVVIGIVIGLFLTWLSSRGRFMFLHCVAQNKAEITIPWTKFRQHANSLFLFRIVLGLIGFITIGLPILLAIGITIMMIVGNGTIVIGVLGGVIIGLIILVGAIIFGLISKCTMDFVVPIMFLRTTSCTAGWREFLTILSVNKARFALYFLFQIVIGIAIGAIKTMGFCIGCCFCGISLILLIPYIGTVILLPLPVFTRSYSLLYLRQYGPEFDVFSPETVNIQPD